MNPRAIGVGVLAILLTFVGSYLYFGSRASAAPLSPSDLSLGLAVEYWDFHTCTLPDGNRAYDVHFDGADRSRRAQLIFRENNIGTKVLRVLTTDPTLPKGYVRFVKEGRLRRDLEGHNAGTAWTSEVLQINPRRPFEAQVVIPPCGPAR